MSICNVFHLEFKYVCELKFSQKIKGQNKPHDIV